MYEFQSCLKNYDLSYDSEIMDLAGVLKNKHSSEIRKINNESKNNIDSETRAIMIKHQSALSNIDIKFEGRGSSKGVSKFVNFFRDYFTKYLENKKIKNEWKIGSGQGSMAAVSRKFKEIIEKTNGERACDLLCQFFMNRPSKEKVRLSFEFMYGLKNQSKDEAIALRKELANSYREYLSDKIDKNIIGRDNSATVFSAILRLPGLKDMEHDTETRAKANEDQVKQLINGPVELLIENLENWTNNSAISIADNWTKNDN